MLDTQTNIQTASSNNWLMSIHGLDEFVYSIQSYSLPGVSLGSTQMPSTSSLVSKLTGDKLQFDPLSVICLHDRRFSGYLQILSWMQQASKTDFPPRKDIIITMFDPLHPEDRLRVKFYDCFPIAVNGPDYDATGDIPTQTVSYTFDYDYFEIVLENS